jgi:hypothetical protein
MRWSRPRLLRTHTHAYTRWPFLLKHVYQIHAELCLTLLRGYLTMLSVSRFCNVDDRMINGSGAVDGLELAGETEVLGENVPQGHFVHHKPHSMWPGIEPRSSCLHVRVVIRTAKFSFLTDRHRAASAGSSYPQFNSFSNLGLLSTLKLHCRWIAFPVINFSHIHPYRSYLCPLKPEQRERVKEKRYWGGMEVVARDATF